MKLLLLLPLSLVLAASGFADASLLQVLHDAREVFDKFLIQMFPELEQQILQLHDKINACYDQSIGPDNETVNIFESKMIVVVEKFFESNNKMDIFKGQTTEQILSRVWIFIQNVAELARLLIKCGIRKIKGEPTVKMGLTSMTAYSQTEVKNNILNYHLKGWSNRLKGSQEDDEEEEEDSNAERPTMWGGLKDDKENQQICGWDERADDEPLPERFSWHDQGYVSPVADQQSCGSCYVFSTTSALESQYMIRSQSKVPIKFSVQRTLNCIRNGCKGGQINDVAEYFMQEGVSLEGYAPYEDKVHECKSYPSFLKADTYCSYSNLPEEAMQRLLLRNGPAAVAIDAESNEFQYLMNGPYTMPCTTNYNHAVLLVGWDEDNWIIKNSWGESWGIKGYLYLPRGGENDNKCGVRSIYTIPIIKSSI